MKKKADFTTQHALIGFMCVNNVCGDHISFRRWEKHGAQSQQAPFPPITAPRGIQGQVKSRLTPPGYMEQCAAGPSYPVRGGVGCKRCSRSVSCVGWVYVCALSLRCCVFFSLLVLALVSPSFQVDGTGLLRQ